MVTAVGSQSPLDLSVEEFLARLRNDRRATLAALERHCWCLNAPAVDRRQFWELFDETVRADGTVDLVELAAHADPALTLRSERRGAASAVVGMCLSAYVASAQTSVAMEASNGVVTIRAVAPPPMNNQKEKP